MDRIQEVEQQARHWAEETEKLKAGLAHHRQEAWRFNRSRVRMGMFIGVVFPALAFLVIDGHYALRQEREITQRVAGIHADNLQRMEQACRDYTLTVETDDTPHAPPVLTVAKGDRPWHVTLWAKSPEEEDSLRVYQSRHLAEAASMSPPNVVEVSNWYESAEEAKQAIEDAGYRLHGPAYDYPVVEKIVNGTLPWRATLWSAKYNAQKGELYTSYEEARRVAHDPLDVSQHRDYFPTEIDADLYVLDAVVRGQAPSVESNPLQSRLRQDLSADGASR